MKRNIFVMLLLSFLTCGIYNLYWMYAARDEFKNYSGYPDINPGLELLFCLLCFPYYYYWVYKFSADIYRYQQENGRVAADISVLNLILAIFGLGLVSDLLIQNNLNEL